jgi:alpha-beta hydrolase superfamily lysophospholipase
MPPITTTERPAATPAARNIRPPAGDSRRAGPGFFGPADQRLFGWFHRGHPDGEAVLLCPPLGHEAENAESSYRILAHRIAARGGNVLRFHYHGTGDSAGSDRDPERLGAWLQSVHLAIEELKSRTGSHSVSVLGSRLGATLALLAAETRHDVSSMALIAPVVSGKRYCRELRAIKLLWGQNHPEVAYAPLSGGDDEAGGYRYSSRTVEALGAIDLRRLSRCPARNVLIIPRDDLVSDDEVLAHRLEELETPSERLVLPGYAGMQRDVAAPMQLLETIASWLTPIPWNVPEPKSPDLGDSVATTMPSDGAGSELVTERPLSFRLERSEAFGILTAPVTPPPAGTPIVVIWGRRRGPNRLFVPLARQLAAQGVPVVRIDLPGLGDAAAEGQDERTDLYTTSSLRAATAMVDAARRLFDSRSIGVVGLCAGAYLAHHAAQRNAVVSDIGLINPPPLYWEPWQPETFFPRSNAIYWSYRYLTMSRAAMAGRTARRDALRFLRTARHRLTRANIARMSRAVISKLAGPMARLTSRLRLRPDNLARMIGSLDRRGLRPLLVFSRQDPGLLALVDRIGPDVERLSGHEVTLVDADHILLSVASQDRARDAIVSHMLRTARTSAAGDACAIRAQFESIERAGQAPARTIRAT